ncbi:MAG: hypothetical protein AAF441_15750 [Pseudomonadota bacterium]
MQTEFPVSGNKGNSRSARTTLYGRLAAALIGATLSVPAQAQPKPSCPSSYVFDGTDCVRILKRVPTCPSGWRFSKGVCERWSSGSAGGGTCLYRGKRGYDKPRGKTCLASYGFDARKAPNSDVIFRSDGRTWRWGQTRSGWILLSVSPPTKYGTKGSMEPDKTGFRGWYESGFCGRGWIELTEIRGSC